MRSSRPARAKRGRGGEACRQAGRAALCRLTASDCRAVEGMDRRERSASPGTKAQKALSQMFTTTLDAHGHSQRPFGTNVEAVALNASTQPAQRQDIPLLLGTAAVAPSTAQASQARQVMPAGDNVDDEQPAPRRSSRRERSVSPVAAAPSQPAQPKRRRLTKKSATTTADDPVTDAQPVQRPRNAGRTARNGRPAGSRAGTEPAPPGLFALLSIRDIVT